MDPGWQVEAAVREPRAAPAGPLRSLGRQSGVHTDPATHLPAGSQQKWGAPCCFLPLPGSPAGCNHSGLGRGLKDQDKCPPLAALPKLAGPVPSGTVPWKSQWLRAWGSGAGARLPGATCAHPVHSPEVPGPAEQRGDREVSCWLSRAAGTQWGGWWGGAPAHRCRPLLPAGPRDAQCPSASALQRVSSGPWRRACGWGRSTRAPGPPAQSEP